jgi:hypothetical protein
MTKRAKLHGFRVVHGKDYPIAALIAGLLAFDGKTIGKTREQTFRVVRIGKWIAGRIVADTTNEDRLLRHKKLRKIRNDPVGVDDQQVGVNYFVFHEPSLSGLYTSYGGSLPYCLFTDQVIIRAGNREATKLRKAAYKAMKAANPKLDEGWAARDLGIRFGAEVTPVIRKEEVEKIIASWETVGGLRYYVSTEGKGSGELEGLRPHTRMEIREYRFYTENVRRKPLVEHIMDGYRYLKGTYQEHLERAVIVGKNERNDPDTLDIFKRAESFGKIDVNALRNHLEIERPDIQNGVVLQEMLRIAGEFPQYFAKATRGTAARDR